MIRQAATINVDQRKAAVELKVQNLLHVIRNWGVATQDWVLPQTHRVFSKRVDIGAFCIIDLTCSKDRAFQSVQLCLYAFDMLHNGLLLL